MRDARGRGAQAFPKSSFIGLDYHDASFATARKRAAEQGVTGNIAFEVQAATEFDGHDFDLICFMDCHGVLDGCIGINSVLIIEVDHIDLQPVQGRLTSRAHIVGLSIDSDESPIGRPDIAKLGRNHDLVATILDRLTH
jgi:hypothetical protein